MNLHKYLIINVLFVFTNLSVMHAQTFEAGAALGFNMSQIDGDALFGFRRIGLAVGPTISINLSEKVILNNTDQSNRKPTVKEKSQVSFGILFSQLGSARGKYDGPGDFDRIRINYVEVPLIYRFKDWKGEYEGKSYYRLAFEGGFTYGRLIDFKAIGIGGDDITDLQNFNPTALNINFGATYFINPKLGVHAHWAKQLNDLDNDDGQMVNRYINVMLYYYL